MILTDTGPIVALLDREDVHHESISTVTWDVRQRLATTEACLTEAIYLINRSAGWPGIALVRRAVTDGDIEVLPTGQDARARAFDYMDRFRDQPCDYADATLLVAAEDTGVRRVFTIDSHFYAYRLSDGSRLEVFP